MVMLRPQISTISKVFLFALSSGMIAAMGTFGCSTQVESPVSTPSLVQPQAKVEQESLQSKSASKESTTNDGLSLQELLVQEQQGQTTLHVRFSKPVNQYRHFSVTQPSRIVLDVLGPTKPLPKAESVSVNTNLVGTLRLSSAEGYLRMAVDLAIATLPPYTVEPEDGGLRVVIGAVNPAASARKKEQLIHEGKRVVAQAGPKEHKKYTEPEVSLVFDDVDIRQVFRFLAEVGGKNIVITDEVKKRITLNIKEPIPWDQALDLLIDTSGLGKEQVGNVIRISTLGQLTKDRTDRATAEKAKELEGQIETVYLSVNYAKVKDLADKIQKVKSPAGTIVPDEQSNTIFVRDIRRVVDEAKVIIGKFDIRTPQVLIESNLIETTPTFARALGFRFQLNKDSTTFSSAAGAGTPFSATAGSPPTGLGGILSITKSDFGGIGLDLAAALEAAETEGNIKIISRPSVVTLNNVQSTIQSLRVLRVTLPTSTNIASGTGAAAGSAVATEKIPVGIILTATPQVSSDGFILMNISVKSSSLGTQSPGSVVPDELSREAIANVLVRDGETIVIGGIMKDTRQESESGIPYLKDIPVLGWLFKNIRWQKDFEELMVFITPRVVAAGSENLPNAEQLWREQMKKTEGG
jgi:type IV pilus secretin PilQ/predicted competence protein